MSEISFVYSQNTLNDIKQYLESNIYPQEITSLTCAFMKKKLKRNFREIVRKIQHYKLVFTEKLKDKVIVQVSELEPQNKQNKDIKKRKSRSQSPKRKTVLEDW